MLRRLGGATGSAPAKSAPTLRRVLYDPPTFASEREEAEFISQRDPVAGADSPPAADAAPTRAAHGADLDTLPEPLQQRLLDGISLGEVAGMRLVCRRWRQLTESSEPYRHLADARCVPASARRPTTRHAALRARLADLNLRAGRVVGRTAWPQPRGRASLAWSSDGRRLGALGPRPSQGLAASPSGSRLVNV